MQLGQERADICRIITQANRTTSNQIVFMYNKGSNCPQTVIRRTPRNAAGRSISKGIKYGKKYFPLQKKIS